MIGIDRKIKRVWLDTCLDDLTRTQDPGKLRTDLDEILRGELPGSASRAKSVGIILRIWSGIPADRVPLRERALQILPTISGADRIWLHWGMTALAYPFFRDVTAIVGRMLGLQDDLTTAQVQERVLKTWGDRATTKEAAQKLLTTLVDWDVLQTAKTKGHFLPSNKLTTASTDLQLWLLEAMLKASPSEEIEAQQLLRLPGAFPFRLSVAVSDLRKHDRLSLHRQGLDMDMVALAPSRVAPPPKPAKPRPRKKIKVAAPGLFDRMPEEAIHGPGQPVAAWAGRAQDDGRQEVPVSEPIPVIPATPTPPIPQAPRAEEILTPSLPTRRPDPIPETGWVPQGPLSTPTRECLRLYQERYDFGCIALAHSVMEAMLRLVCREKLGPRQAKVADIRNQFAALSAIGILPIPLKTRLEQAWLERIDYLELSPAGPDDREKIAGIAEAHVRLLIDLERHFFGSSSGPGWVLSEQPESLHPEMDGSANPVGSMP